MKRTHIFLIITLGLLGGCNTQPIIQFQDDVTKQICVANWDANKDGEIQFTEVSTVSTLGNVFQSTDITSFEELQHFTSLNEIGWEEFRECSKLKNIVIPNSVSKIGKRAFFNCASLQSVNIPCNVRTIGDGAFCYCTGKITINSDFLIGVNYEENINPSKTWLYGANFSSIHIGNSVSQIGDYALAYCTKLTSITIGNGVCSMGFGACSDCWCLKSIVIPESVKNICSGAFSNCRNLESVTLPNSIEKIDWFVFAGCSSLEKVIIPDSVKEIGMGAFRNCSKLNNVVLGTNVFHVGTEAFFGCSSLTNITIPTSLLWFDEDVFKGCVALPIENDIRYADTYVVEAVNKTMASYKIKEGSRIIGDKAFMDCKNLKTISLPESITTIGDEVFKGCSNLKKTVIHEKVSSIGLDAFYGCTGELQINSNLVEKDYELKERPGWVVPSHTYKESSNYWLDNSNFSKITIGDNIQKLGSNIFYGMWKLKTIVIPKDILSIGDGALGNCDKLTHIYCKAEFPPMTNRLGVKKECVIHVPKQSVADYKSIPQWGEYTIVAYEN